jgi:hypothetical protein
MTDPIPNVTPTDDLGFLNGEEAAQPFVPPAPETVITVRTSGGDEKYIPASEPMSVGAVMTASGLYVSGNMQYWLNGAEVDANTLVPPGQSILAVGSIKGG